MPSRFIQANSLCIDEGGHNPLIDLLNTDGELYSEFSDIKELNSIIAAIIQTDQDCDKANSFSLDISEAKDLSGRCC
jgi:hypothetical protein